MTLCLGTKLRILGTLKQSSQPFVISADKVNTSGLNMAVAGTSHLKYFQSQLHVALIQQRLYGR
jgi:hypothetical protein